MNRMVSRKENDHIDARPARLALVFTVMAIGGKGTLPAAVLLVVITLLLHFLPIGKL